MSETPTQKALPTVFDLTPLNPDFSADPHALLDRLREQCPVRRDTMAGTFILTRYADVRGVLSDTSLWRDPDKAEADAVLQKRIREERVEGINADPDEERKGILLLDDPDHARIRNPLAKALYKRVARWRPQVEAVVNEILDQLNGRERFDVMADFAILVPIDVIARILGVDETRLGEFRKWSEGVILFLNPFRTEEQTKRLVEAGTALSAYMKDLIRARRADPQDDLVSDMVALQ